jgi:hypothetical protein
VVILTTYYHICIVTGRFWTCLHLENNLGKMNSASQDVGASRMTEVEVSVRSPDKAAPPTENGTGFSEILVPRAFV